METRATVTAAIKEEVKRGSRYDTSIARKLQESVHWLEKNFNMEHMKIERKLGVSGKLEDPSSGVAEFVYGLLVGEDSIKANFGSSDLWLNENPALIKSIIRVGIAGDGSSGLHGATHKGKVVQSGNFGAENLRLFEMTQVPFEDLVTAASNTAPKPVTIDGVTASIQMPTQFAYGKYLLTRPENTAGTPYDYADYGQIFFNGPMPANNALKQITVLYWRYTSATVRATEIRQPVFDIASSFLIASTLKKLAPTMNKPDMGVYWGQIEAEELRTLGMAEEEKEFSSPPMEMGYYPNA